MAEIVFSMELRGSAAPVEGRENVFHAQTSGTGPGGQSVAFESEVVLGDEGFVESGTINYAGRGGLTFDTVGIGHMRPSAVTGLTHGSIIWNIVSGDGEFEGATGLVTSNFTLSEQGQVVDNHYVRAFTP
jgi:hypothetical protein